MSLPSRERGLKFQHWSITYRADSVAPLVGARIEIRSWLPLTMVHPRRSPRGSADWNYGWTAVGSLAEGVAPLAGAWIEIPAGTAALSTCASLPSRERGLKCLWALSLVTRLTVAPLAGAWIEIFLSSSRLPPICCRSPRGSADWNRLQAVGL